MKLTPEQLERELDALDTMLRAQALSDFRNIRVNGLRNALLQLRAEHAKMRTKLQGPSGPWCDKCGGPCKAAEPCRDRKAGATSEQACVTPNGRMDGHMKFVKLGTDGSVVCKFCGKADDGKAGA